MRVDLKCREVLFAEVIDDPLYVLTIGAAVASQPRNRLRPFAVGDRAQDLSASPRQPKPCYQACLSALRHRFLAPVPESRGARHLRRAGLQRMFPAEIRHGTQMHLAFDRFRHVVAAL
jgi:hypothetical protein